MKNTVISPEIKMGADPQTATRVVLVVEYEGTNYHGFQWQAGVPTIQSELEGALLELTGERSRVMSASRTDSGVHARGQVVSFRTESQHSTETFIKGLNYYLPADIAVKAAYRVNDSFNVRHRAVSREYNYCILNSPTRSPLMERFSYLVPEDLDVEVMNQGAQALIGQHDFVSFVSNKDAAAKNTVRRVYRAEFRREGESVIFDMEASSFLMHQVRNTVGTLLRVGRRKVSPERFYSILEEQKPGLAWPTAPAHGLCLMQVKYQNPFEDELW